MTAYREALKRELVAKQTLLQQTKEAITKFQAESDADNVDYGVWNHLAKKQMYTSSRADPIGIASLKQSHRMETQQNEFDESETLLRMLVDKQKGLNQDMSMLLTMLEDRLRNEIHGSEGCNDQESRVQDLRDKIDQLIEANIAMDMASPEFPIDEAVPKVKSLIHRLLDRDDTLTESEFRPNCMSLYRLLDKAYLLRKTNRDNTIFLSLENFD